MWPPGSSTLDRVKQDIVEKSLRTKQKKAKNTRDNHKGMVVVPYVKGLSKAFARILKSHGIVRANCPHRTLRNFVVHPKDKVKDEEKTELICRVPCKNCSSSYVGETCRKFGLSKAIDYGSGLRRRPAMLGLMGFSGSLLLCVTIIDIIKMLACLRIKEHKKEVDSFTAGTQSHRPEHPGQGRAV